MKKSNLRIWGWTLALILLSTLLMGLGVLAAQKGCTEELYCHSFLIRWLISLDKIAVVLLCTLLLPVLSLLFLLDSSYIALDLCVFGIAYGLYLLPVMMIMGFLPAAVALSLILREKPGRQKTLKVFTALALIPNLICSLNAVLLMQFSIQNEALPLHPMGLPALLFCLAGGLCLIPGFFLLRKLQLPPNVNADSNPMSWNNWYLKNPEKQEDKND